MYFRRPVSRYVNESTTLNKTNSVYTCNGLIELDQKDLCYIDEETCKALELIENNVDSSNRRHSLLDHMNSNTSTTTGARLLKESILRPLFNFEIIEERLDCINYLVERVDTLSMITNCLKKYGQGIDLDSVPQCLVNLFNTRNISLQLAERRLEALSTLDCLVNQIRGLVSVLDMADQPLLNSFKISLQDPAYDQIAMDISSVIDSEAVGRKNRKECGVAKKRGKVSYIRSGVDALFDIARSSYTVTISELENYVRELMRDDGLPWKLSHTEGRGYYLSLNPAQLPRNFVFGPQYLRVNKSRVSISCTTKDLMQANVRANVSYENSMKLANEVLASCLSNVINNISAIYRLVSIIGNLDLVTCFAKSVITSNNGLVRPKFTSTETHIVKARHPVLEAVLSVNNQKVIPNDVTLASFRRNVMLITGPNMGGKSVYLKQVGIVQIMAQIGSFVPAEIAEIRLVNRIIARSGSSDDDNSNCSSFMWEMRGIASALHSDDDDACGSVLYLIDEVGRGTSIDDGASYSFAIAEELALQKSNFTVFATHFEQVFSLSRMYPNVAAYHFKYEEDECDSNGVRRQKLTHNLVPGLPEKVSYGIKLAEMCGLPKEILDAAKRDMGVI